MRRICLLAFFLFLPAMAHGAETYYQTDVGGGGWLQSAAFHPNNPNIILMGTDVTGGIYRTDDFGLSWTPWNEGLANTSAMKSMYVEDLIGLVEPDGSVAFYAATHAGIYRATEDGPWEWMAEDQPQGKALDTENNMIYWDLNDHHREPVSFSCLAWNGEDLLVAGAGRVRWGSSYETDYYPNIPAKNLIVYEDPNQPQFSSNPALCSVWVYDLDNLDNPDAGWQSLDADPAMDFGTVRDISVTKINGHNYIVLATTNGIFLHDYEAGTWQELSQNYFLDWAHGGSTHQLNYGSSLTCWSIHITKRGTVFAAMERIDTTITMASGVYRIYDVVSIPGMLWTWIGNGDGVDPHTDSMWTIGKGDGFFGEAPLVYLSVVDGSNDDPDTLYLGCRTKPYGLFRGTQPNSITDNQGFNPLNGSWTSLVTKTDWVKLYPADFDFGWLDVWGIEVIFEPAVLPPIKPGDPIHLACQFNGRMHLSNDGGNTFLQRYTWGGPGAWFSNGYNEHCTSGITFMSDGRIVFSNGDSGTFVSTDNTAIAYDYIHPVIYYESTPEDDKIKNTESYDVHVRPNWRGQGRDALFINYSDAIQKHMHGKLFFYREPTTPGGPAQWVNITKNIPDLDHYIFLRFTFSNDSTCFMNYLKFEYPVGSENNTVVEYGVQKGVYDPNFEPDIVWNWSDLNDGLPPGAESTSGADILYNHVTDSIFLALTRNSIEGGGLYMLPTPKVTVWQVIYDGTDTQSNPFRDFRSLAQPPDGSLLYAGTRGRSGGVGAVLKCIDPSDPLNMDNWVVLANDPDTGYYPFGFSNEPPFWYGDMSWLDTPEELEQHLTYVAAIAVDPENINNIYVGLHAEGGFNKQEGLWYFNSDAGQWHQRSLNKPFYGMGIMNVGFNPHVLGQLFLGTTGQGMYFNGVLPDPWEPPPDPNNPPIK